MNSFELLALAFAVDAQVSRWFPRIATIIVIMGLIAAATDFAVRKIWLKE